MGLALRTNRRSFDCTSREETARGSAQDDNFFINRSICTRATRRRKEVPLDEAPQALVVRRYLVGHEDGVDDVDDAIRLEDIGCGDGGHASLCVGEHGLAAGRAGSEGLALD